MAIADLTAFNSGVSGAAAKGRSAVRRFCIGSRMSVPALVAIAMAEPVTAA
jgi:hypothetical protein